VDQKGITHDERISSTRAKAYPLLVMSNHGRWRYTLSATTSLTRNGDGKIRGWTLLVRALLDASEHSAARGIKDGDIVKSTTSVAACSVAPVWNASCPGDLGRYGARQTSSTQAS